MKRLVVFLSLILLVSPAFAISSGQCTGEGHTINLQGLIEPELDDGEYDLRFTFHNQDSIALSNREIIRSSFSEYFCLTQEDILTLSTFDLEIEDNGLNFQNIPVPMPVTAIHADEANEILSTESNFQELTVTDSFKAGAMTLMGQFIGFNLEFLPGSKVPYGYLEEYSGESRYGVLFDLGLDFNQFKVKMYFPTDEGDTDYSYPLIVTPESVEITNLVSETVTAPQINIGEGCIFSDDLGNTIISPTC